MSQAAVGNRRQPKRNCTTRLSRRGSSIVEFALIFLMLMLLLLGIFEGGRLVWTYTTLVHAARQGARFAMVHGAGNPTTNDQIKAVVDNNLVGVNAAAVTVNTTWIPNNELGSQVQVQLDYQLRTMFNTFIFAGDWIPLRSRARAPVLR